MSAEDVADKLHELDMLAEAGLCFKVDEDALRQIGKHLVDDGLEKIEKVIVPKPPALTDEQHFYAELYLPHDENQRLSA